MGMTRKQRAARVLIEKAADHYGSKTALAAEMRVTENAIRDWLVRGRVPGTPARLLALLLEQQELDGRTEADLERILVA